MKICIENLATERLGKRHLAGSIFNRAIMTSRLLCTSFFLVLFISESDSQPTLPISFKKIESHLLSNVDVLDLYVAPQTNITWIKTTKGMMSFDGIELVAYEDTLPGHYFSASLAAYQKICIANDGRFFLWKYNAGLISFDTKTGIYEPCLIEERYVKEFRRLSVISVLQDKAGDIWLSTLGSGIVRYSINDHSVNYFSIPDNEDGTFFTAMSPDYNNENYLWLGVRSSIWKFSKREKSFSREFFPDTTDKMKTGFVINTIADLNADTLVFTARGGGLGFYQKLEKSIRFYPADSLFYAKHGIRTSNNLGLNFCKDDGKGFYVGYGDHIPVFFNTKTKININIATEKAIRGHKVFLDHAKRLWTFGNNAIYYSVNRSSLFNSIDISFQHRKNIVYNALFSLLWDETSGKYLAGINQSDGVTVWDSNFIRTAICPVLSPADKLQTVIEVEAVVLELSRSEKNYWAIGRGQVLLSFDTQKKQFLHTPLFNNNRMLDPITNGKDKVLSILNSRDRNTYALLGNWSVLKINDDFSSVEKGIINDSLIQKDWFIGKIFEGVDTNFLYITDYSNIYILEKHSGKVKPFILADKKNPIRNIIDVAADANENFWVASVDNKIICYNANRVRPVKQLTAEIKLSNSLVITPGNILLCSEKKSLIIYDIAKNILWNYGEKSGILPGELSKVFYANDHVFLAYPDRVDYSPLEKLLKQAKTPTPYLAKLQLYNNDLPTDSLPWYQHTIKLDHKQNNPTFTFSLKDYDSQEDIVFYYRLLPLDTTWTSREFYNRVVTYTNLKPEKYKFQIKAKISNAAESEISTYEIIIRPAFWQTDLFKIAVVWLAAGLCYLFLRWRINSVRRQEKVIATHEKQLLELESKALRAQMNPHFIFNSLNSIKALINKNENDIAANYLTTFSKLIRTLFQNSNKREVSLFDELETCKHYTQLEKMRFGNKVEFVFDIDESLDLKDIRIPALILQPFIENAIWHGLVPKEKNGTVTVAVKNIEGAVECIIDDDGIGRELSRQFKAQYESTHESKGIGLTQSRLELDKILNEREDSCEIIDKKNPDGSPAGTTVIITFKENEYDQGIDN